MPPTPTSFISRAAFLAGCLVAAALTTPTPILAYNNGDMTLAPPLGWQTWCSAGTCGTDHCFDFQIRETAKAVSKEEEELLF